MFWRGMVSLCDWKMQEDEEKDSRPEVAVSKGCDGSRGRGPKMLERRVGQERCLRPGPGRSRPVCDRDGYQVISNTPDRLRVERRYMRLPAFAAMTDRISRESLPEKRASLSRAQP